MRADLIHLTAGGVSVLLDLSGAQLPTVTHWGAALGDLAAEDARAVALADIRPATPGTPDVPVRVALLPEQRTGWVGRPGISGSREDGSAWSPVFTVSDVSVSDGATEASGDLFTLPEGGAVAISAHDPVAALSLTVEVELSPSGVLRTAVTLTNDGAPYRLVYLGVSLPRPARASEMVEVAVGWA